MDFASSEEPNKQQRVVTYIDGFNLHGGMKEKQWKHCYWLDLVALSKSFLVDGEVLEGVKYFTSRITNNREKLDRQNVYLQALATYPAVEVIEGFFQLKQAYCAGCNETRARINEKRTDVNIALEIFCDAISNRYDRCIIVSGDSDLATALQKVREFRPDKIITVAFPPERISHHLRQLANSSCDVNKKKLRNAHLPNPVLAPNGESYSMPIEWIEKPS
jgi:uncharacterized LabA/DUF88 family protein